MLFDQLHRVADSRIVYTTKLQKKSWINKENHQKFQHYFRKNNLAKRCLHRVTTLPSQGNINANARESKRYCRAKWLLLRNRSGHGTKGHLSAHYFLWCMQVSLVKFFSTVRKHKYPLCVLLSFFILLSFIDTFYYYCITVLSYLLLTYLIT